MRATFSVLLLFVPSVPLAAQSVHVAGRVLNADSLPVQGVRVVLHRVGQTVQGPMDSALADNRGRFSFTYRPDTAAFYLASGRYAGIEYFSSPLPTRPTRSATNVDLLVYDTSATAPVELEARHLVLTRPGEDGTRSVLDLIILRNAGRFTRVARDSLGDTWGVPLPTGTVGLQVGESDVSSEAISRRRDSLVIGAAIAPGEKQLTVQYQVPGQSVALELPLEGDSVPINVLIEEPGVRVSGPGMVSADSQVIQGRAFRRWAGTPASAGVLRLELPGARPYPRWVLPALVGLLGLGLAAAGWFALGSRRQVALASPPTEIIDAIARLDLRYQGREGETPEKEWSFYLAERARLKQTLQASLATDETSG